MPPSWLTWPAWFAAPVWDDDAHIPRPDLRSLAGLGRIWAEPGATQQYYPLAFSAFWLQHKLWGDATLREQMDARRALYRTGHPWRE